MLTGRRAFSGDTKVSTLAAILNREPQPLSPTTPRELDRIVTRCLKKDPARRWQTMADLKVALEELKEETDSAVLAAGQQLKEARWKPPRLAVAAATILLAAGAWWWSRRTVEAPDMEPKVVPLTAHRGDERDPSFSPDGSQIAFTWAPDEIAQNIYIKLIGPGEPIRLTYTSDAAEFLPKWSPDGKWIAFQRNVGKSILAAGVFVIPALGGPERALAEDVDVNLGWSPDSRWVGYTGGNPHSFYLASPTGAERKLVTGPLDGKYPVSAGIISPDGRKLAVTFLIGAYFPLYVVPLSADYKTEGPLKLLSPADWVTLLPVWTQDSKEILFIRGMDANIGRDTAMFRVSIAGGVPKQVQFAGENPWAFDVARQGHRMAFTRMHRKSNIYRVEFGPGGSIGAESHMVASSSRQDGSPTYSPNGERIAFVSNRSGLAEIWTAQADGQNPIQLTTSQDLDMTRMPQWSPDGREIAYTSKGISKPEPNIFVISAAGGVPRRVTDEEGFHFLPSWSRDGRWIYFAKSYAEGSGFQLPNIWKVPAAGGKPIQVTRNGGAFAQESLDRKWLYFSRRSDGGLAAFGKYRQREMTGVEIRKMPLTGGDEQAFARDAVSEELCVTAQGIYYFGPPTGRQGATIRFMGDSGGTPRVIASIQRVIAGGLSLSPDGHSLLFSQWDQSAAELMLVENFR
jgi:Tol biopolymer transport system component